MFAKNVIFYFFCFILCINTIFSADEIKSHIELKYKEIKEKEKKVKESSEEKIKKLDDEIHQARIEIIKIQTQMLPHTEKLLGEQIKCSTGMIFVVSFFFEQPSIAGKLSATILQDGTILTSAHALLPLLKEPSQQQKFLLFFIPDPYLPTKDFQKLKRNYEKKILETIHQKAFRDLNIIEKNDFQKQMFSTPNVTFLTKDEEEYYKKNKLFFRFKPEEKMIKYKLFVVKDLMFPGKIDGIYHKVLSNTSTDIAIGSLAHTEDLPKSPFVLKQFSSFDQEIFSIKQIKKNLFVASSTDYEYFFSGGEYPVGINSVEVLRDKTLRIPIPQALGCSGGALIIAPEVDEPLIKDLGTLPVYKTDYIEILGVVRGRDDEGNDPSMGLYSTWHF